MLKPTLPWPHDSLPAEVSFLLQAARQDDRPVGSAIPSNASDLHPDWSHLLALARRHRLGVLLANWLLGLDTVAIPRPVRARLTRIQNGAKRRALGLARELLGILERLEEAGIDVTPIKGPALASRLYEDISLRPFGDLDLLVRPADRERACEILLEAGFEPELALEGHRKRRYDASQHHYQFRHHRHRYLVELHFRLDATGRLPLDANLVWEERVEIPLGGRLLRVLSADDLLVYLTHHGARHQWDRLIWLCDVQRLLRATPELGMKSLTRFPSDRRLRLGLRLAHELLEVPLDDAVRERLYHDPALDRLVARVVARLGVVEENAIPEWERLRFRLGCEPSLRGRLGALRQLLLEPQIAELESYPLPDRLDFFYPTLRLVRLVTKHGGARLHPE